VIPALVLAFLSGFIALSYEILWYRAYAFMSMGTADTFGAMLGAYLSGLAIGAVAVRRLCRERDDAARVSLKRALFGLTVFATLAGYAVVPALGAMAVRGWSWKAGLPLVGIAAAGLGTVFPVATHLFIEPDDRVGRRVSYVYLANILGSTAGSLLTGFVLMDHLSLGRIHEIQAFLGLGLALFLVSRRREAMVLAALALLVAGLGTVPFAGIYERLQLKSACPPGYRFAQVVETKSGVITVNEKGQIFGGGIYDGAYNTGLEDDKNTILRCYALAGLRPATKDVLMIGLSSGSWATVIANNPTVERFTIVEINPGYLRLLPEYPAVAGLLRNRNVTIEIDDGRRWLVRHKDRRFDAIVANATFHWRSNASNLLSAEFLELVRSRLNPGGYYYYNTTESGRVLKTGCSVFPYALKVGGFLAVSDAPLALDLPRLRERLFEYPWEGKTIFDRNTPGDDARSTAAMERLRGMVKSREEVLAGIPASARRVTDDNMGTEWGEGP
jgi:spermidine synthase